MFRCTIFALLIASPLFAQTADEKKATVRFLASLQQSDGGFIVAPQDPKADGRYR